MFMKRIVFILSIVLAFAACKKTKSTDDVIKDVLAVAETQYGKVDNVYKQNKTPRTLHKDGKLKAVSPYDWTSGFYAGNMWYMYGLTGDAKWKNEATQYTEILDTIQYWTGNHDVGFMINCSYGNGYRIADQDQYKKVMVTAAESLSQRFSPITKTIKSWDYRKAWNGTTEWFYPVIIDNMMNLELLFEASKISKNKKYYDIAVTHANTTMKNHYREDYSSYHVIDYDTINGSVLDKATCQGFADNSSWARGQSWGLYGYVVMYRETKDAKYLDFAKNIANYIMTHPSIPADKVPYWDYHVDKEGYKAEWSYAEGRDYMYKDVSSATIAASALVELSMYVDEATSSNYISYAKDVVANISSSEVYTATPKENNYFILKHSMGSIPHGGDVDKPVNYADYYYLETLLRLKRKEEGKDMLFLK